MIKIANTDPTIDNIKTINLLKSAARGVQKLTAAGRTVVGTIPTIDARGVVYQGLNERGYIDLLDDRDVNALDDQN